MNVFLQMFSIVFLLPDLLNLHEKRVSAKSCKYGKKKKKKSNLTLTAYSIYENSYASEMCYDSLVPPNLQFHLTVPRLKS